MKLSNLALRMEPETEQPAAESPAHAPADQPAAPGECLARTRRPGLDYRAILIRDEGFRLFRVY